MRRLSTKASPQPAPAPELLSLIDRPRVEAELEAMEGLGVDGLRLQWRNRWGRLAPAHLSRGLLFRVMAYRIQAEAFGDLDRSAARALDRLATKETEGRATIGSAAAESSGLSAPSRAKGSASPLVLKPGALLTREWQGRIERVMVLDAGFAWNGKTYASMSAVAVAITGVKWSGHRFFFGQKGRGGGDRGGETAIRGWRKPELASSSLAEAAR